MAWDFVSNQPVVSIGGGYIRVWRPGKGLTVELPACVVVETATGNIEGIAEEAADLEGKLPPSLQFVRPFWADRIVNRAALRILLQEALRRDRKVDTGLLQRWTHRYSLRLPESTPRLHRTWLLATCREVWPLPWKIQGSATSLQTRPGARADVGLYLDLGFSGVHATLLVGTNVLAAHSSQELSFQHFCHQLTQAVQAKEHVRIAPAVLYGQQWFTQQAGLHEKDQKPVLYSIPRPLFAQELTRWAKQLAAVLQQVSSSAPPDVRSHLSRSGVSLVGGGAEISELVEALSKELDFPVQVIRQPKYATLREKGV